MNDHTSTARGRMMALLGALALALAGCGGGGGATDTSSAADSFGEARPDDERAQDDLGPDLPADPGEGSDTDPRSDADDTAGDTTPLPEGPISAACTADADCLLACAKGTCDETRQRCVFVPKPGRCVLAAGPLDDGLVACFDAGQASPQRPCLFCQPALAQDQWSGAALYDDMEQPAADWVLEDASGSGVAWHRSNRRAGRGTWSLHAGTDGGPYGGAVAVDTRARRDIDVPDVAGVRLRFDLWLETEGTPGYDLLEVAVTPADNPPAEAGTWDDSVAWSSDAIQGTTGGIFRQQEVDLEGWRGQRVAVTLRFRTGDDKINQFEGAYLDAFEVWSGCCTRDAECDDRDPCTEESCRADGKGCARAALPDCCAASTDCDDGDPCTLDTCPVSGGRCEHEGVSPCCGADADCDDGDPCTVDTCPVTGGACQHLTTCCEQDADCQDGDPCTQGFCQGEACVYVDTCCHANADCDDGELCTKDLCQVDGSCAHKPAYLPGCCVPELHEERFDAPTLGSFSFSGGAGLVTWQHVLGERAASAPGALYYGDLEAKSYDAGGGSDDWDDWDDWDWGWYGGSSEGDAETGPILLPPGMGLTLRFALWIDVETCCDYLSVRVDDGVEETELWKSSSSTPQKAWHEVEVDLSSYAGRSIWLRFHFYADSSVFKEGAWVDDVRLLNACAPRACAADGDCQAWGSCWEAHCKAGMCVFSSRCCTDDTSCDDGDPCTTDACEGTFCAHHAVAGCCNGQADCDDGNPCTADACPGAGELCQHTPVAGCCLGDGQCDDGDACTYDRCQDLTCSHAPACCQGDDDCDDDDACTADACAEGACVYTPTWAEGCCYTEPYAEGFEVAALAGYTFEGGSGNVGWHVVTGLESATGEGALYYGNPDTLSYAASSGHEGRARSGPIQLPPDTAMDLSFQFWQHTESSSSWDYTEVWVLAGERAVRVWKKASSTPQQAWTEIHADLSPFGGLIVHLEFRFKADASISYEGVFVDDVRITSTCAPKPCQAATDCATPDTCWKGTCTQGACTFQLTCCLTSADCDDGDWCTTDACGTTGCTHVAVAGCCMDAGDCDDGDSCTVDGCPVAGEACAFTPIPDCCHAHTDCEDEDPCTRDRCDGQACTHLNECCAGDEGCDDGDPCTAGTCVEGRCAWTPTEAAGCCQTRAFESGFEEGLPAGFVLDPPDEDGVGWSVASGGELLGGNHALYFGNPATWSYDTGLAVSGTARLQGVTLAPGVPWALQFALDLDVGDTGTAYDAFSISVATESGSHVVWTKKSLGALHVWESHVVDLSAFGGRTVDLVLRFDSKDATNNGGVGLLLDDLALVSPCLPRTCLLDSACSDGFAFSIDRCDAAGCAWQIP